MSKEEKKGNTVEEEVVEEIGAESFQCPGCGANMRFDADAKALKCDYCGNVKKMEYSDAFSERDFSEIEGMEIWKDDVKEAVCKNCGAHEMYHSNEVASVCPFCGSPMVLSEEDYKGVKPNVIIPFALGKDKASEACRKWLKGRIFAPHRFKKNLKVNDINGIYCPVWTFDSQTVTNYSGILGRHVTRTYTVNGKTHTRVETQYFPVNGQIFLMFDDIMVSGSDTLDSKTEKNLVFKSSEYVKFDNVYLAGYSAVGYTVQPMDAWKRAEAIMKERITQAIKTKHRADVVQSLSLDVYHEGKSFKYMLVPFYVSACKYKEKIFKQFVNGINSKVTGKSPVSPIRVCIAVLLGLGLVALIAYLFMTYGDGFFEFLKLQTGLS